MHIEDDAKLSQKLFLLFHQANRFQKEIVPPAI